MMNEKKPWEIDHDEAACEEGGMALGFLQRTQSMISQVQELLDAEDSIPAWVTSKLTSVYEDMNDVHAYLTQLDSFSRAKGVDGISEAKKRKKKKGLWHNIHARRKARKRPLRPGEKGYPKTLDIESVIREFVFNELKKR
jgi:hypothetical protein